MPKTVGASLMRAPGVYLLVIDILLDGFIIDSQDPLFVYTAFHLKGIPRLQLGHQEVHKRRLDESHAGGKKPDLYRSSEGWRVSDLLDFGGNFVGFSRHVGC